MQVLCHKQMAHMFIATFIFMQKQILNYKMLLRFEVPLAAVAVKV
jgi:hypothetical protein